MDKQVHNKSFWDAVNSDMNKNFWSDMKETINRITYRKGYYGKREGKKTSFSFYASLHCLKFF